LGTITIVAGLAVAAAPATAASASISAVVTTVPTVTGTSKGILPIDYGSGPSVGFGSGVGHFTATPYFIQAGRGSCPVLEADFTLDDGAGNAVYGHMDDDLNAWCPLFSVTDPVAFPVQMQVNVWGGTGAFEGARGTGTFVGVFAPWVLAGQMQANVAN
jgi:hypothetical protein